MGGGEFGGDLGLVKPTGQGDTVLKAVPGNLSLYHAAQFTVTDERKS